MENVLCNKQCPNCNSLTNKILTCRECGKKICDYCYAGLDRCEACMGRMRKRISKKTWDKEHSAYGYGDL